jgi:chromosome segregation ATPase
MEDKLKLIIPAVGGVILCIIIIFFVAQSNKIKSLENDKAALESDKASLTDRVNLLTKEKDTLQEKVTGLTSDLENLNKEKDELQGKFDVLVSESENLKSQVSAFAAEKEKQSENKSSKNDSRRYVSSDQDDAYWASILKNKVELEVQVDTLKEEIKATKESVSKLTADKNNLVNDLKGINRDTEDLQHSSDYNQKMVDSLTKDLASGKFEKLEMDRRLGVLKGDNLFLRQQVNLLNRNKVQLESKLLDLQSRNASLEKSLAGMEAYVKEQVMTIDSLRSPMPQRAKKPSVFDSKYLNNVEMEVEETGLQGQKKSSIELPPIIVRPQGQGSGQNRKQQQTAEARAGGAEVVSVDRDNNFVVINVGKRDGVKISDTFQVYRFGQQIGSIEILQARESISACDIKEETVVIAAGDMVK